MKRLLSLLVLCALAMAASPVNVATMPEVRGALVQYENAEISARAALITKIAQLQEKATKAGKLDEAVALRDLANSYRKSKPATTTRPESPAAANDLIKHVTSRKWQIIEKVGNHPVLTLGEDMSLLSTHHNYTGTWTPVPSVGKTVIRLSMGRSNCNSELLALNANGDFVTEKGEIFMSPQK